MTTPTPTILPMILPSQRANNTDLILFLVHNLVNGKEEQIKDLRAQVFRLGNENQNLMARVADLTHQLGEGK
jgi:hypothetical protein